MIIGDDNAPVRVDHQVLGQRPITTDDWVACVDAALKRSTVVRDSIPNCTEAVRCVDMPLCTACLPQPTRERERLRCPKGRCQSRTREKRSSVHLHHLGVGQRACPRRSDPRREGECLCCGTPKSGCYQAQHRSPIHVDHGRQRSTCTSRRASLFVTPGHWLGCRVRCSQCQRGFEGGSTRTAAVT